MGKPIKTTNESPSSFERFSFSSLPAAVLSFTHIIFYQLGFFFSYPSNLVENNNVWEIKGRRRPTNLSYWICHCFGACFPKTQMKTGSEGWANRHMKEIGGLPSGVRFLQLTILCPAKQKHRREKVS